MPAIDWSMLTALPRRIIGSLGPTKADLAPVKNHTFYEPAAEANLSRNWIGWLAEAVGLPLSYSSTSLQGRMDAVDDPDVMFWIDRFEAVLDSAWALSGAGAISSDPKGGFSAPLDAGATVEILRCGTGGVYGFDATQNPRLWARFKVTGSLTGEFRIGFASAGGNGWRLLYDSAASANFLLENDDAGVATKDTGIVVALDTWYTCELLVDQVTGYASLSLDGATPVVESSAVTADQVVAMVRAEAGGGAGGVLLVDVMTGRADWSR